MKIPRDISSDELVKVVVSQYGYSTSRQTGSHIRLTNEDKSHSITIPNHKPIKIGTLSAIIKDVCTVNKVSVSDFVKKL
jgi:predicted RNA binding protein YcfA (HicA-like mRNA interferase family)